MEIFCLRHWMDARHWMMILLKPLFSPAFERSTCGAILGAIKRIHSPSVCAMTLYTHNGIVTCGVSTRRGVTRLHVIAQIWNPEVFFFSRGNVERAVITSPHQTPITEHVPPTPSRRSLSFPVKNGLICEQPYRRDSWPALAPRAHLLKHPVVCSLHGDDRQKLRHALFFLLGRSYSPVDIYWLCEGWHFILETIRSVLCRDSFNKKALLMMHKGRMIYEWV